MERGALVELFFLLMKGGGVGGGKISEGETDGGGALYTCCLDSFIDFLILLVNGGGMGGGFTSIAV